jgi:spermidine synthase
MPSHDIRRLRVLLLFVGSGLAALVYEIVWFQALQLVIGSSSVSMGVLLGTFMGGMCAGSLLLARSVSARHHPLRVYATLELGIAAFGLLSLVLVPATGRLYVEWAGDGRFSILLRGAVAALCLLPPTLAMGATLPAIGRWVESTPRGMSSLGLFYAGNIAGAVAGSLLAGFYLLRIHDVTVATMVAVACNVVVALLAWRMASRAPYGPRAAPAPSTTGTFAVTTAAGPFPAAVLAAIALSGFCALSAEVVWTRYLTLLFGGSVYAFAIILAVFLVGLGLGSGLGSALAARARNPAAWLAACQLVAIAAMLYTAVMLARVLPAQPGTASLTSDIWMAFLIDFRRAFIAVLPAPVLWGASFPLALAAAAGRDRDTARLVGVVYAANTAGAIAGAMLTSLVLIGGIGSQRTQQVMVGAAAVAAVAALLQMARARGRRPIVRAAAAVVLACVPAAVAARWMPSVPALLVAYGRNAAAWVGHAGDIFYVGEGVHASVAVSRLPDGVLNYHNAGKIQASSQPQDMRLQRMLGHLTTLIPHEAKSVLVIGCGAGVTAGAVSVSPKVERVTIAEIEPLVPAVVSQHFAGVNHDVLRNPKVRIRIDDARHFLATTQERFDAITSDPLDPWVKGAAALYTKEFFELAKSRLEPGGVVTLFVQLYESSPEAVKSEIATFFDVFPHGMIFGNTFDGHAEDTVLVGTVEPPHLDLDTMEWGLQQPEYAQVRRSLGEIGIYSIVDLLGRYAGRASDLAPWLMDASINRDRNLRLQYLAGLGLNRHEGRSIYQDLLQYRRFPDDVFVGSDQNLSWLRASIEQAPE